MGSKSHHTAHSGQRLGFGPDELDATYRIKTLHTGSHQLGGARKEYELLVANYELKPGDLYVEKTNARCPIA